jgi:hypothetical protein
MMLAKKVQLTLGMLMICAISFVVLNGCKDDEVMKDLSDQDEVSVVQNATISDNSIDEELEAFDESVVASGGGRQRAEECPTVTRNDIDKTIALDFGTGCLGRYGRTRSGKVLITYGGTFDDALANRTITFDNYFVNNRKIEGTVLLRDFNRDADGILSATREVVDYKVIFADGDFYTMNGSTTREWIEGEGDGIRGNEVIRVTGSYEGVNSKGVEFKREITTPVIANFACWTSGGFLRTKGVIQMTITNSVRTRTRTLDYGDGTCDNTAAVTVNDKTYTITITN